MRTLVPIVIVVLGLELMACSAGNTIRSGVYLEKENTVSARISVPPVNFYVNSITPKLEIKDQFNVDIQPVKVPFKLKASLDTLINNSHLKVQYLFPENVFKNISLNQVKQDSISVELSTHQKDEIEFKDEMNNTNSETFVDKIFQIMILLLSVGIGFICGIIFSWFRRFL